MRSFPCKLCKHTHTARLEASIIFSARFISQLWQRTQKTFTPNNVATVKEVAAQNISKSICLGFRCIATTDCSINNDNAIAEFSNLYALANYSKMNITDHINRLKHDTKSRKEGRRNERNEERKKKRKEESKDRAVRDIICTKENQKLSLHQSSQAVPARPYGKGKVKFWE
jgi:hypothetical protein